MQELLQELIAVNKEMLSELRLIRQALSVQPEQAESVRPSVKAATAWEQQPAEPHTESSQFSPADLAEGDFAIQEAPRGPAPRFTPQDLEDIHGNLVSGLKQRNKDSRDAYEQFEKRHKKW